MARSERLLCSADGSAADTDRAGRHSGDSAGRAESPPKRRGEHGQVLRGTVVVVMVDWLAAAQSGLLQAVTLCR